MTFAFWRRPDAKLYRNNDTPPHAPSVLFSKIGANASVATDNTISWPWTQQHEMMKSAFSSIAILDTDDNELNESDTSSIVSESVNELIRELGGGKPISAENLLKRVNNKAGEFFRLPKETFTFVASLSIESKTPRPSH